MAAMDEDTLKAITDEEIRNSVGGTQGGKLSAARRKAEYYYLGLPKGDLAPPEVDGRSTFVDTTVRNQIEWMMPSLMKTFCSGESVVQFTASKEGDEDKADLATDYINHLFYKKNLGYTVLQTAMRDALLQKAGIIKIWWDNRKEESREEYRGMADVDLALLMEDDEVTPIEQSSYPDEDDAEQREEAIAQLSQQLEQALQIAQTGQPEAVQGVQTLSQQIQEIQSQPPKMLYDVSFKRSKTAGKLCIEAVPPEEFLISRKSKNMIYGDEFQVECPTNSGHWTTLKEVAAELSRRLASLFLPDSSGRRPCHGEDARYTTDPNWRDLVLFYEYFHGDTGRGCGASHQTGWTALVTRLLSER